MTRRGGLPRGSAVRRGVVAGAVAGAAMLAPLAMPAVAQQTHLIVITGQSGEPQYAELFHEWASTLVTAAKERHRVQAANIVYLGESPARDPSLISGESTRANVEQAIRDVARRAQPNDIVYIVLIGHGSYNGRESQFNVPGPNLSAADFAGLLAELAAQRVAFVNTSSASGDFIPPLSGPNRAIVTATRDGRQNNATIFPRYFVQAFAEDVADSDRDGRVSLLEAFTYARQEVAREYETTNRIRTEHALLDDNGDGVGTAEPDPRSGGDGSFARTLYLGGATAVAAENASPELRALYQTRLRLESELDALRGNRANMEPARYEAELERLLLELSRTSQSIRELEEAP